MGLLYWYDFNMNYQIDVPQSQVWPCTLESQVWPCILGLSALRAPMARHNNKTHDCNKSENLPGGIHFYDFNMDHQVVLLQLYNFYMNYLVGFTFFL